MFADILLHNHLQDSCPDIHSTRLQAVMDVAAGLTRSQELSISSIGRCLVSDAKLKHKIKKVDRLVSNKHLYSELSDIYSGLSSYVFKYLDKDSYVPIVVDLCYLKDTHDMQMLSAEVATQGRTIPIYRDVFEINNLKGRAQAFISKLIECIPKNRDVLLIMDAGFGDDWFEAIEANNFYWLVRARGGKFIKLSADYEWREARELFAQAPARAKCYNNAFITKRKSRPCRVIMKKGSTVSKKKRPENLPRNYNSANGNYQRTAQEPWILATNLPESYDTTKIINAYKKRMQIEESFKDVKSHRYGLASRYIQTRCVYRWGVCMLLAAITQITLWILGVVGHAQGMQQEFSSNSTKHKKVFSYFYLGKLIVDLDRIKDLKIDYKSLPALVNAELARVW